MNASPIPSRSTRSRDRTALDEDEDIRDIVVDERKLLRRDSRLLPRRKARRKALAAIKANGAESTDSDGALFEEEVVAEPDEDEGMDVDQEGVYCCCPIPRLDEVANDQTRSLGVGDRRALHQRARVHHKHPASRLGECRAGRLGGLYLARDRILRRLLRQHRQAWTLTMTIRPAPPDPAEPSVRCRADPTD